MTAVIGLLLGALVGSVAEQYSRLQFIFRSPLWHSVIFSTALLFFCKAIKSEASYGSIAVFLLVLTGGFFLSISCSGILPEGDNLKEKAVAGMLGAVGFMIGTWHIYTFYNF